MVIHVAGNGLRDWIIQRVSAVIVAAYVLFLVAFFIFSAPLQQTDWSNLFMNNWMRISSMIVLLSLSWHAWIGLARVTSDYIVCGYLRLGIQVLVILALFAFFIWGVEIFWSVR